eukprot:TRINITY_DN1774_c0_g1_i9.p1 TRINITY_DN1774_c0_g1~~TRINITY_DN1774_c0_g1_i9.p1  ORF type:complete len:515 (-),score=83.07 TRINITY_DN1774_c0_g1_i9:276-1820(-)
MSFNIFGRLRSGPYVVERLTKPSNEENGEGRSHNDPQLQQHDQVQASSFILSLWHKVHHGQFWVSLNAKTLINPESIVFQRWEKLLGVLVIYTMWSVPFIIAFNFMPPPAWFGWDYFVDICFILNVFITFRVMTRDGKEWVTDSRILAVAYLKSWFIVDLFAAFPFYYFIPDENISRMVRIPRLLLLSKSFRFTTVNIWGSTSNFQRVIKITLQYIILGHWIGCAWALIARLEDFPGNGFSPDESYSESPIILRYLLALAWAFRNICSFGSMVRPMLHSEHGLTICLAISGVVVMSNFLGSMTSAIESVSQGESQFVDRLRCIDEYMNYRKLPSHTKEKVRMHYQRLWLLNRGLDENNVLSSLPRDLRAEVATYLRKKFLEKLDFFKDAEEDFIKELSLRILPVFYSSGEYIFRQGEHGSEMYFINRGSVQIIAPDGRTIVATLSDGAYFGEIALLTNTTRTASVCCVEHCELYILRKSDLDPLLSLYPNVSAKVREVCTVALILTLAFALMAH